MQRSTERKGQRTSEVFVLERTGAIAKSRTPAPAIPIITGQLAWQRRITQMNISRCGSQRFRGMKELANIHLNSGTGVGWMDNVRWDAGGKEIIIGAYSVPSGTGPTRHNYSIRLSLHDVSAIVSILGHTGSARDASLLRDHLAKHVPALVKLLACATGVVPTPMPEVKPTIGQHS
jgi:hypothetical protein